MNRRRFLGFLAAAVATAFVPPTLRPPTIVDVIHPDPTYDLLNDAAVMYPRDFLPGGRAANPVTFNYPVDRPFDLFALDNHLAEAAEALGESGEFEGYIGEFPPIQFNFPDTASQTHQHIGWKVSLT